ncbi:MAG: cystathionine gamma-synthase, partial [Pirellulaceae bacterium]|nr:cystathionine gamma-synthase [Pirellulaceae bacterium]
MRFSTKAIRLGQPPDPHTGSVIVPVYQTTNFVFDDVGQPRGFEYSRSDNPTRKAFEECLAGLEEARFGLAFGSGMAAVDAVLSLLRPGDHVVSAEHIYGGTYRLFEDVYVPRGVTFSYVDGRRPKAFAQAMRPNTKLVWIETPANPLLQLVDVRAVADLTEGHEAKLVADNTFSSPYLQRPLMQGVDVVVHSTTKYISGHSDVVGGAVLTNDATVHERVRFYQNSAGAVPGPWDCWLSLRGLKTLAVRMQRHVANAQAVAEFLRGHAKVEETIYPGLADHPDHQLAKAQMDGFGAIVTFRLSEGTDGVRRFVRALETWLFAESLGGVESLVCHPATMSHASLSADARRKIGISDGTIRLSVGIEDIEDLLEDLERSLGA